MKCRIFCFFICGDYSNKIIFEWFSIDTSRCLQISSPKFRLRKLILNGLVKNITIWTKLLSTLFSMILTERTITKRTTLPFLDICFAFRIHHLPPLFPRGWRILPLDFSMSWKTLNPLIPERKHNKTF